MAAKLYDRSSGAGDLRLPPHSIEAEQSVLGGLMLDAAAWDQVGDRVSAEDFYRHDHRLIFEAAAALVERSQPCDAVTLSGQLESQGLLDQVGGLAYLGSLARDTPTAANIRAYAGIVRERAVLRQLITAGNAIVTAALEPEGREAREIVDEAERAVFDIAERGSRGKAGYVSVKQVLPAVVQRIDELYHSKGKMTGVPTGFKDLDRETSGLQPGDLIIVAGRPSMGKTTLAVNMAENAALGAGKSAAIFSMEMSAESLTMRMISSLGRINQSALRSGQLHEDDWPRIDSAMTQLSGSNIYIDETPALTPTEIRARARRLKRERGLDLIVVDYIQLMQIPGNKENRATEVSEISRSLKALARELNVPVIALSQLNRGVEQRENKKPLMSDLRECVTGDTLVCLGDGRRVPISDLVGQTPEVMAMSADQKIIRSRAERVWSKGQKPVYTVTLASGRRIRATRNHRLFTGTGWAAVSQLGVGSRVALGRKHPEPASPVPWTDEAVMLLGHLLGEGNPVHRPLRYTTASEENSHLVRDCAIAMGSTVTCHAGAGARHELVIDGNGPGGQPAGVGAWLAALGIGGQRPRDRRLPAQVFGLADRQLALLLRHLWAADGRIRVRPPGSGAPRVYLATGSQGFAYDIAAVLLRLGIMARIRCLVQRGGCDSYSVDVRGPQDQRLFVCKVGAFGPRLAAAERLEALLCAQASAQVYTSSRDVCTHAMAARAGSAHGGPVHVPLAPARVTPQRDAQVRYGEPVALWSQSDLFWDHVVNIEAAGEAEVFDLTVPGPASWLADGIVSHNSGGLEQDADLILLIYREDFYQKDTTRKGIADIIIAKHRNGATGEVQLTFLGQYTRFENYAPESYAEGVFR